MLSQASVSPRAQRTMATKFDPHAIAWLAGSETSSPSPSAPSASVVPYLAPYGESPRVLPLTPSLHETYFGTMRIRDIETNVFRRYIVYVIFDIFVYVRIYVCWLFT